jgi:hypothetical protein
VPFHGRAKDVALALGRFETHFDPLGQHLRFFTRRSLRTTLEATGFRVTRIRAQGGVPPFRESLVAWASR